MTTFPCTSTNVDVARDESVDYGTGNSAADAESDAILAVQVQAQADAQRKAENEHACEEPCRIEGTARLLKPRIEVAGWQDPRGLWHATARVKWFLTVYCRLAPVTAKSKRPKRKKKSARTGGKQSRTRRGRGGGVQRTSARGARKAAKRPVRRAGKGTTSRRKR